MTDATGHIVWSATYRAYGSVVKREIAEVQNPLRFQGQYYDPETGLHYNRHRYYNPATGRFITPDPIGLAGGLNNYQYVPNPTGWVDPLGLACEKGSCPGQSEATPTNNSLNSGAIGQTSNAEPTLPESPRSTPGRGYHNETYAKRPVKPEEATQKWEEFLGPGPYSNVHPRTDEVDSDRLVSLDGKRSIRYGAHEMNSKPTKHHYHEETWIYDSKDHVMNVESVVVRVPLPRK